MHANNYRIIKVAAGIGDNVWLLMKLVNSGERFEFHLPDGKPRRGKQIFDLFPQVTAKARYTPNMGYKILKERNIQRRKPFWEEIDDHEFYLCANRHLELGHNLTSFLPDLPISYTLDYKISDKSKEYASYLLPANERKYIGVYTSAYSSQRNWGFWDEKKWFNLIKKLYSYNDKQTFILIGAEWDTDLTTKLDDLLVEANIPFINTVGADLGTVVEMMRKFSYAFYFPSGLPILSETAGGSDSVMFYPKHLEPMIATYANPRRIESGQFKECVFCEPETITDWVVNHYKLYDRL